jgi:TonB family protein
MRFRRLLLLSLVSVALVRCGGVGVQPDATVGDMPSKGPVGKTMTANKKKFEACGRESVTVQTDTTQDLELSFTVEPDGSVRKAKIARMSAPDPDLYECVLKTLKRMHFPPPKDGKSKEISYPLVLKPE